jgi:site-specific DNA recombinase
VDVGRRESGTVEDAAVSELQAAIYARVSSEQQAEARTIASQVAALRARVLDDGVLLVEELAFIDEGY